MTSLTFGIFGARGDTPDVLLETDVLVDVEVVDPGELSKEDRLQA